MSIDGWSVGRLGSVCSIEIGGTPSRSVAEYWDTDRETENVWVSIKDMRQRVLTETAEYISDAGVKHSNAKLQPPGTVLLSFKLTIGRVAVAGIPLYTNEAIAGLRPTRLSPEYLYHGLQHWDILQGVDQAIKGATLNKEKLKWIAFEYPENQYEQTKIAEILSTVDRAIEQTEAIIAKQQRIKTGLMQDLLTRGIDEHGNIRSEETHEFKDSPLGRIPVEWAVKTLFEVYAEIPKNGIFKTAKEIGRGSLMIGQTSFTSDRRINYKNSRRATISISELMAYKLQENDILVTRVYATVYGVGLPVLVGEIPEPAVYESNMLRLRVDTNQILPKYTFYWLMSAPIRTFIVASVNASNQTSINQQVMNSIPITFPKKTEQETIVDILAKSEKSIEDSTSSFRKLQSLKTALMQDLLTGKKRVTAVLNDTEVT